MIVFHSDIIARNTLMSRNLTFRQNKLQLIYLDIKILDINKINMEINTSEELIYKWCRGLRKLSCYYDFS